MSIRAFPPAPAFVPALLVLAVLLGVSRADDSVPMPRSVVLEHILEIPETGEPELRWQLRVPLERLVFRRRPDAYVAEIRLACQAERRGDGHVENVLWHERVEKPDFASCRVRDEFFEKNFKLGLGPGRWRIEVLVYGRGSALPWRKTIDLEVPTPQKGNFFLQGPRWPGRGDEGSFSPPFRFADSWGIAEERARFIDGLDAQVTLECDAIFWEEPAGPVEAVLSLEDRNGGLAAYARRNLRPRSGRSGLSWQIPVGRLGMGAYLLRIDLNSKGESRQIRGRLDIGLTGAAFGRNWEETRRLLTPLSLNEEVDAMALALPHERPQLWRDFWARRDPSGEAPGNEALETFCSRLNETNLRFSTGFRPGYMSDRGQVYLEHGEPDRMVSYEDERSYRVLLYWHYTHLGLVYIFEDRHGNDDFVLIRVTG